MKKQDLIRILTVLILLNLWLIWGNSLMTGTDSGAVSGGILARLGQIFPGLLTEEGHHFLRKAAHFSEFCLLGVLCTCRQRLNEKETGLTFTGWGLFVACIDETIQTFVPDRGPSLIDVWIDTAGFAAGVLLVAVGYAIAQKRR